MQRNAILSNNVGRALAFVLMAPALASSAANAETAAGQNLQQTVTRQSQITGTIVDEIGETMVGVTIRLKGSTAATITNLEGQFTVDAAIGATLEVTYVGYATQSVKVTKSTVNIQLSPDSKMMDEVVVVGYGTVKKRDMLGAISQVKAEEIKTAPVANALDGLQGKIAGLDITNDSGEAGSNPTILLRGNRSLDGSNDPLVVIDGVSGGSLSNLNPNDIESIEVLKDASSTAIYGSAGANGVIIVTTKQGTKGKITVDLNAYCGINCLPAYPETYQGKDWINYMAKGYEAYYGVSVWDKYGRGEEGMSELFREFGISQAAIDCYNQGQFINWKDEILQTGIQQNYNVSVRGGTDRTSTYVSVGYQDVKGMYRNDEYQQFTFRAGATYQLNKMLNVGFQSSMVYKNKDSRSSRLSKSLNEVPVGEVYNADGSLKWHPTGSSNDYVNIMADDIDGQYANNNKSISRSISPFIELKPIEGLSFKSLVNVSLSNARTGQYEGLYTYYKLTGSSQDVGIRTASMSNSNSRSLQWQNILNYSFKVKDIHDIGLTGIMEWNKGISESSYAYNRGFDYDSYTFYNLGGGLQPTVASGYKQTQKLSYAGRVNYSLLGCYLFSASIRWDGASVLYNHWDSFPAVSAGWRIIEEDFMQGAQAWMDNLKLRVGYGVTGNSNVAAYSSKTLVESSGNTLNLGGGQVQSYILSQSVANYNLSWEKSYNWNIGIDFGFMNGRIDGSLEWYKTDSKGVLYKRPLPTVYGLYNSKQTYTMMSNIAKTSNTGVELSMNTRNIVSKRAGGFSWNSTLTFTRNVERLENINLGNGTSVDDLIALGLFIDNPVKTFYGYKKLGIWQLGEEDKAACFGLQPGQVHIDAPGLTWDPTYTYMGYTRDRITSEYTEVERHGAYYSEDENGNRTYYRQGSIVKSADGTQSIEGQNIYSVGAKDKQILGHNNPDFTIGFTNTFSYAGFDLSVQTVMRWGQMVNGDLLSYVNARNQPRDFDYWTPENPTNAFPLAKLGVSTEAKNALQYVDGSFVKIKNITLGYTLPKSLLKKVYASKMRLYATIQNPFIFAKDDMMKGLDPENTSSQFPLYKTIAVGVNCSF